MSRHSLALPCGSTLVYGFDRPCSFYFVQVYVNGQEAPAYEADGPASVLWTWADKYAKATGTPEKEVLGFFPDEHLKCAILDIPIP